MEEKLYLYEVCEHLQMEINGLFDDFDLLTEKLINNVKTIEELEIIRKYKALMNKYR